LLPLSKVKKLLDLFYQTDVKITQLFYIRG